MYDEDLRARCDERSFLNKFAFCGKLAKEYKSNNRIDMASKRKNFYLSLLIGYFAILLLVILIFWLFYRQAEKEIQERRRKISSPLYEKASYQTETKDKIDFQPRSATTSQITHEIYNNCQNQN